VADWVAPIVPVLKGEFESVVISSRP